MSELFPQILLSATEEDILSELFSNPVTKKYLRILALEDTKELLALSAISTPDTAIVKAHATVQGKLAVLSTLLSIQAPQPKE